MRFRALLAACVAAFALTTAPAVSQVVRQVTDELTAVAGPGALDDAGAFVFAGTSADLLGNNPRHDFRLVRFDAVTGTPTELLVGEDGVTAVASVSDDGRYVAFPSPFDLVGDNADLSLELFVLDTSSGVVEQLTDDPAPNAGSVGGVAIAGDGSRVAFTANTDPLGTNPGNVDQLFVVERDGTGLAQLTAFAADGPGVGSISIADDGTRVAFGSSADPLAANPDGGGEVFAVDADGSNLRQLTATVAGFDSGAPVLSGNGQRIAFQSNGDLTGGNPLNQTEIFAVEWDGSGLRQLTSTQAVLGITGDPTSQAPSITDDGSTIVFFSNESAIFPPRNIDGNFEIYRVQADGTGLAAVTSSIFDVGSLLPVVSGSGNRIAFFAVDTGVTLRAVDGSGGSAADLVPFELIFQDSPDIAPDGSRVVYVRSQGVFATGEVWAVDTGGGDRAPVTSLGSGVPGAPSIAGDATTIVFTSDADPLATNADGSTELFSIQLDGSGLTQLTDGPAETSVARPAISGDGSRVVFDWNADPLGQNVDLSRELFAVGDDGAGLAQLTVGAVETSSRAGRVDTSGTWAVFESNADLDGGNADGSYEVYRVRTDGTALERLTGDAVLDSRAPDVSPDGSRVVYTSSADPLGSNPDANVEIFAYEPATLARRQLTDTLEGDSGTPRFTADAADVTFGSNAPIFEDDPDAPFDLYRVPFAGGTIERIGALRFGVGGALSVGPLSFGGGAAVVPDDPGAFAVFGGVGDFTGGDNVDGLSELWVIDRTVVPSIFVSKATPTVVTWDVESGPVRYDVVRGDVASLALLADGVDLGSTVCVDDDSPDATTEGSEDTEAPSPGQVFFYVYRGSQGLDAGPGSYGTSSDGRERLPSSGDCGI